MKPIRTSLALSLSAALVVGTVAASAPAVLTSPLATGSVHRAAPSEFRPVTPGQIGKTKAGMTVAEAFATGEFKKNVPNPPCGKIPLQPTGAWKDRYVVFTVNQRVAEMDVFGKRPRSSGRLGVGSTAGDVFAFYGGIATEPQEWGYGQWATFVPKGVGKNTRWLGFLFGNAFVDDGPLKNGDKVTLMGVRKRFKPGMMIDGC